jgi:hypothetical protein
VSPLTHGILPPLARTIAPDHTDEWPANRPWQKPDNDRRIISRMLPPRSAGPGEGWELGTGLDVCDVRAAVCRERA